MMLNLVHVKDNIYRRGNVYTRSTHSTPSCNMCAFESACSNALAFSECSEKFGRLGTFEKLTKREIEELKMSKPEKPVHTKKDPKPKDHELAFPFTVTEHKDRVIQSWPGMEIRDVFANTALECLMKGMDYSDVISELSHNTSNISIFDTAYKVADAMMKARKA